MKKIKNVQVIFLMIKGKGLLIHLFILYYTLFIFHYSSFIKHYYSFYYIYLFFILLKCTNTLIKNNIIKITFNTKFSFVLL